tara:strand:- start:1257 stop:2021 length:765 start_codon:yes stop_codon:yes gene_type:complete
MTSRRKILKHCENKVFTGIVSHTRHKPFKHTFKYKLTYFWFDINYSDSSFLFKKNKFSLFSFYEQDHGPVKKITKNLTEYFNKKVSLKKKKIKRIQAFCLPRMLGYVFNPISIFLLYNYRDIPEKIIFEVSNTFGERHAYLSEFKNIGEYTLKKKLYVSPFFKTEGKYKICFKINKNFVNLIIFYEINNKKVFEASFIGKSANMSNINLIKIFFKNIFQNPKVTLGIYIQALKLWFKGATYINKPKEPKDFITK